MRKRFRVQVFKTACVSSCQETQPLDADKFFYVREKVLNPHCIFVLEDVYNPAKSLRVVVVDDLYHTTLRPVYIRYDLVQQHELPQLVLEVFDAFLFRRGQLFFGDKCIIVGHSRLALRHRVICNRLVFKGLTITKSFLQVVRRVDLNGQICWETYLAWRWVCAVDNSRLALILK